MLSATASLVGWCLLHFLWQGALLGTLAWIALTLLPRAWVRLRYGVACALLGAMALAPLGTALALLPRPPIAVGTEALRGQGRVEGAPSASAFALPAPGLKERLRRGLDGGAPWLALLWLPGACFFGLRMAGGGAWLRRARRRAEPVEGPWATRVLVLAKELGLSRMVDLRSLPDLEGPVVLGVLRPVILVPLSLLSSLPPEQVDMLLRHELAHVRRQDYLVNLLQRFLEAAFFFHPAVWWLSERIREERELCADALATAEHPPVLLAEAITGLLSLRLGFDLPDPAFALGALDGALGDRLKALLDLPRPKRNLRLALLALPLLLLLGLGTWGIRRHRRTVARKAQEVALLQRQKTQEMASGVDPTHLPNHWRYIWVRRKLDHGLDFYAPWATPEQMIEAFDTAEAFYQKEGRLEHCQELKPTQEQVPQRRYNLHLEGTRQVILETLWRLKSLPEISRPADALVVRRDNLLLPGDDPLDPPLDVWVPKAVDQFYPEMAQLLRSTMLELKALPVTPGQTQELRRPIPGAILAAMKAPQAGEPQYRLGIQAQRGYIERSGEKEFQASAHLRYDVSGAELGRVPGLERLDKLVASEEPEPPRHVNIRGKKGAELDSERQRFAREEAAYKKALATWKAAETQRQETRKRLLEEARNWATQRVTERLKALKAPAEATRVEGRAMAAFLCSGPDRGTIRIERELDPSLLKLQPLSEARFLRGCLEALKNLQAGGSGKSRRTRRR